MLLQCEVELESGVELKVQGISSDQFSSITDEYKEAVAANINDACTHNSTMAEACCSSPFNLTELV